MPLSGIALALRPDFLALVLLYWCIQEPRLIGVGIAWCSGLLMDVADGTVFGQHALAYAVLAYAPDIFAGACCGSRCGSRRRRWRCCCCCVRSLVVLVRIVGGAPLPRWSYVVGSLTGALLWPVLTVLLQWPQRPQRSTAEL